MKAKAGNKQSLTKEHKKVLEKYLDLLESIPGPVSVWATTDEGLLHLYTLIAEDDEIERQLYNVELALMRVIDSELVDFDVYVHPETVHQFLFKDQPPLYQRS